MPKSSAPDGHGQRQTSMPSSQPLKMRAVTSSRVVSGENIMRRILPSARSFWISRMSGLDDEQQEHDQHAREDIGENIEANWREPPGPVWPVVLDVDGQQQGDR